MNRREVARRATALGVPEDQVRRDELISHVLAEVDMLDELVFFGGTALCRTHLPDFRLSEDIDLLAADPAGVRDTLSEQIPRALRRMYPECTLTWQREGTTWMGSLSTSDSLTIRVQVVPLDESYRRYPVERATVQLRYAGLPDHRELTVPTAAGVAAMKLNAWAHRRTPRDLCDLWGLHDAGHLDVEALEIARDVSAALQPHSFQPDVLPTAQTWQAALGAQMQPLPDRHMVFHRVRSKIAALSHWPQAQQWNEALGQLEEDPRSGRVPGREFLDEIPDEPAAELLATLKAVEGTRPPFAFRGGARWQAMHGDMSGWFEARDKHRKLLYRLFVRLDREAPGLSHRDPGRLRKPDRTSAENMRAGTKL